jgi:hypothetical protein
MILHDHPIKNYQFVVSYFKKRMRRDVAENMLTLVET